ncbi:nucleotidyltransferase domain protein [Candidatus Magnetobacterium bavaricum]|uniref:Nucleotidyltransferase domain protein n=1 Tax=Candidatus Magnetobacterium bavaricum TaxID=29290 RepID=A0A0F3H0H7_9BACT|nr:nucleotidyltransferase domain protein [Candidatus Magnetobacterium bavaricum]
MLVEFREDSENFDNYIELKYMLEKIFDREIDLVTEEALKPRIRDDILREVIYV